MTLCTPRLLWCGYRVSLLGKLSSHFLLFAAFLLSICALFLSFLLRVALIVQFRIALACSLEFSAIFLRFLAWSSCFDPNCLLSERGLNLRNCWNIRSCCFVQSSKSWMPLIHHSRYELLILKLYEIKSGPTICLVLGQGINLGWKKNGPLCFGYFLGISKCFLV